MMTIIIAHNTTPEKAIEAIDRSLTRLFEGMQVTVQKKQWNGRTMEFAITTKLGFISLPVSGTIVVDDVNVTVYCELPGAVKKFIGEDKVRAGVEKRIRGLLKA